MRSFTDNKGDKWHIDIGLATVYDVHTELGYALDSPANLPHDMLGQLALLAVICREQIDRRQLSEREFVHRFSSDAFDAAMKCVEKEYHDFLSRHRPLQAEILRQVMERDEKSQPILLDYTKRACSKHFSSLEASLESTLDP